MMSELTQVSFLLDYVVTPGLSYQRVKLARTSGANIKSSQCLEAMLALLMLQLNSESRLVHNTILTYD